MVDEEILLIQGPPGSGKTSTIIGIISLLLKNKNTKILVCAPSNAAIDEICVRLAVDGIYDNQLKKTDIKFLRFGLYDNNDTGNTNLENSNAKLISEYCLEYMSGKEFNKDIDSLKSILYKLQKELYNYNMNKRININKYNNNMYNNNLINSNNNIEIGKYLESEISKYLGLLLDKKSSKKNYELKILQKTSLLCTTLNNAGNEKLKRAELSYEYLIVDEACQCVEPSLLIPLYHNVRKMILIGDHMQL